MTMNKLWIGLAIILVFASVIFGIYKTRNKTPAPATNTLASQNFKLIAMKISSPAFADNQSIPLKYSCEGQSINPPLEFSGVPEAAKSLALIMDDPDVPKNLLPSGLFVHWVVFNMPASTAGIAENSIPPGVQGNNGAGKAAYTGPCPPDRQHRYFFKLYALDGMLDLPSGASKEDVEKAMQGHIIEQSELIGLYNKKANQ